MAQEQESLPLPLKYRRLSQKRNSYARSAGETYDYWPYIFFIEDAAKHIVVTKEIVRLVADITIELHRTPDSEVVLPERIRKILSDLDAEVLRYFDMQFSPHQVLEVRDTRPSKLPEDPELGGK